MVDLPQAATPIRRATATANVSEILSIGQAYIEPRADLPGPYRGGMADVVNPYVLPDDLPVPVDDGAADHLEGAEIPALSLPATSGDALDLREAARGTL